MIRQGVREGAFETSSAEHTAGVLVALLRAWSDTRARLLLASSDESQVALTYLEAIERVLGAAPLSLTDLTRAAEQVVEAQPEPPPQVNVMHLRASERAS